jgi:putative glycerol-1-phosphate prenyltransferase
MQAIYLDAGSGAERPVPASVIAACRACLGDSGAPLFVGGGIRRPEEAALARAAGADFVVIGSALERENGDSLAAFVRAVRDGHP